MARPEDGGWKSEDRRMEELDLDSFLQSHRVIDFGDGEDDPQSFSVNHRTVDEILLLNESSSSSSVGSPSPVSSPCASSTASPRHPSSSSYSLFQSKQIDHHDNDKTHTSSTNYKPQFDLSQAHSLSHSLSLDSKFNSPAVFGSAGKTTDLPAFSSSSRASTTTLLLPPLFSAVRTNAKPGAALAAAAAASRSIPTPHAAAIKSSRTSSAASFVRGFDDSRSSTAVAVADDSTAASGVSDEVGAADDKCSRVVEEKHDGPGKFSAREGNWAREESTGESAEAFHCKENQHMDATAFSLPVTDEQRSDSPDKVLSTCHPAIPFDSHAQCEKDLYFDENSDVALENEGEQFQSSSFDKEAYDEDAQFSSDYRTDKVEMVPLADPDGGKMVREDKIVSMDGNNDENNAIPQSGHDVYDISSQEEIDEIVQDAALRWESKTGFSKIEKNSQASLSPLELAEESEKKQAFTGIHLEEGAAAQPMRLEGVRRGSTVLGYFDVNANNAITRTISSPAVQREHGFPQVLAVHGNYIAVGMSKGVIIVAPSKYQPYQSDNMDTKMLMLGLQGDRSYVPVTSMCFNQQGDLLFAGYGNGHFSVWDVQKASVLKVITDLHKAPLVHMLYMGQDSQVTRQFNVVTGDNKGLVKLTRFNVLPFLNRISYSSTTELLNETTPTVVCAAPLLSWDYHGGTLVTAQGSAAVSTSSIGSMMGGVIGGDSSWKNSSLVHEGVAVFVTHQAALVAKVSPTVEPYAQILRPEGVGEGSIPYAAWKLISESQLSFSESSERYALLAIAWDQKVQVAKLVKSELKVYGKWTLESPAVGVAWLDDQMLVVLTSVGQLCLFAKNGNMIHQTSFAVEGCRGDDLMSYHTYFNNTYGNPERAHHNCIAVRGASIYVLGPSRLVVLRLLPWKERIEVLRRAGDWMGALNMAMTLYDGQAHGVIDLPRSLYDVQETVMPYLVELLLSYVDEVFSYIQVASGNQVGDSDQSDDSNSSSYSDNPDIKEQYIRVGGVAVEFCVHIKRTDILFDEIFSKFCASKHKETFLELLEPYILKDMLGSLPPAIMQALVEHYSKKGWLQRVEQCVLHMDISSLDFNQVVLLCREHRLHGALIYLFNKGLDDFRTPLEELLLVLRNCQREAAGALGYRMLVYLKYCFQGLAFPPGRGCISPARLQSVRKELLQFLLEDSSASSSWATVELPSKAPYPNLCHLLELDTDATLNVLGFAFEDNGISTSNYLSMDLTNTDVDSVEVKDLGGENEKLVQEVIDVLSVILDKSYFQRCCSTTNDGDRLVETWPSEKDAGCIFEFIARYVACGRAKVSGNILSHILEYLTLDAGISSVHTIESSKRREKQLLALLEVVPETDWDGPYLLHLCEKCQFHQACGFIHAIRHQHLASLDSYMKAMDEPIHAFSFIRDMMQQLHDKESDAFRVEVISRIPDLVILSREATIFLVVEHFYGQIQQILFSELQSHPKSLFLYLKTLIEVHSTGNLDFSCLSKGGGLENSTGIMSRHESDRVTAYLEALVDFPKILRNNPIHVTDEMTELYLELLCHYERQSVLKFLETFESYRVENCLRLCQENGIIDATAFLLERVGEVGSALLLYLSGLSDKFDMLDAAIANELSDSGLEHFNTVLKKEEVKDILNVVHSCIGLCQRNSPRLDSHESEYLWFQLLDSFCEPLVDLCSNKARSAFETSIDDSVCKQEDAGAVKSKWKISKSQKGAHLLRKLLSVFIKEIVEGMIGYVRLPTIMLKLLSDNGSQEFGDFKLTILGMLGTYDFERRILDTAKSLIEDDSYYTMSLLKKGASHGYAPRSLTCCVCNGPVMKSSQSSSIQVFACGHAMHVNCEPQESESSVGGSSSGCPICVPRKKRHRSVGNPMLVEKRLVGKASSRSNKSLGTLPLHAPPDVDSFENMYGSHPLPRFELLSILQKDQRSIQIDNMPQLRLAPPAVYHDKVKKGTDLMTGESSSSSSKAEKSSRSRLLQDVKGKGSSIRFPLRPNIFGKDVKAKR